MRLPITVLDSAHQEDFKTTPTCLICKVLVEIFKVKDKPQFQKSQQVKDELN